jgi:acyl-CoA thioesterase-2
MEPVPNFFDLEAMQKHVDAVLTLEELDPNLFRAYTPPSYLWRIFGGQTIAQSLMAAYRTVQAPLIVNSLHAYFLRGGRPELPTLFFVDRIRDGRKFSTRHVTAVQKGKKIFSCLVSFHVKEPGWTHQIDPPSVAPPAECKPELQALKEHLDRNQDIHPQMKKFLNKKLNEPLPLDFRFPPTDKPVCKSVESREGKSASKILWARVIGNVRDDIRYHHCMAAFMCDYMLMGTSLLAHNKSWADLSRRGTGSLDHVMWFHNQPFRADDFLLYVLESPQSGNARGLNFGRMYDREGNLIISLAQEGLMRPRDTSDLVDDTVADTAAMEAGDDASIYKIAARL